eukprot:scaffold42141_cov30-Tisochrysis_lutea.AAC.4
MHGCTIRRWGGGVGLGLVGSDCSGKAYCAWPLRQVSDSLLQTRLRLNSPLSSGAARPERDVAGPATPSSTRLIGRVDGP